MEKLTGKGYLFVPDSNIGAYANATVTRATGNRSHHALRYAPSHQDQLPYLIAHESGHLLRLYEAPEKMLKVPHISEEHRARVGYEVKDHLLKLARLGMPEEVVGSMLKLWHEGLVRQLFNIPADMRIERWMLEN